MIGLIILLVMLAVLGIIVWISPSTVEWPLDLPDDD